MELSRRFTNILARAAALVLAVTMIVGCDSDSGGDDGGSNLQPGTFQVEIAGGSGGSFSGNAVFGTATDPQSGSYFALILTSNVSAGTTGQITYIASRGGLPATGSYSFGDAESDLDELPQGTFVALVLDGGAPNWSRTGSLQIESSSSSNVAGSFQFEAVGIEFSEEGEEEVTKQVSGSFNAVSSTVVIPF